MKGDCVVWSLGLVFPSVLKSVTLKQCHLFYQSVADIYWASTNPWVLVWPVIVCYSKSVSLSKLSLSIISGWVAGFYGCLINSVRQLWTQFSALWAGTVSVPDLCPWLLHAGIKEQRSGQHRLLWQRIMMPFCGRALWLLLRASLLTCREVLWALYMGVLWVCIKVSVMWVTRWEDSAFPGKGCPVGPIGSHKNFYVTIHRAYNALSAQEVAISASCSEPGARTSNANCLRLYSCGCASWNNLSMVAWPRRHNSLPG